MTPPGCCAESPNLVESLLNDGLNPNTHHISLIEEIQYEPFGDSLFAGVPDDEMDSVFSAIESRVEVQLREGQTWYADYRRLRIRAIRE